MRGFTFGSVCSGIEAASVAFGPLGMHASWLSEIEPFPSAVLAHHYPDVPNLGDMTTLPERILLGEVSAPDLFCGGTPCQAFSVAGLRKSLDDARGNLSLVFCEIANAIDIVRTSRNLDPAIIFWENVPGVLNTKDNAFGCFLAGLAGEDLPIEPTGGKWTNAGAVFGPSRAVAWRVLDAQYFGVAQRRRRVFVVASARDEFDPAAVLFEWEGLRRDTAPSREAGKVAPTIPSRSTAGGGLGTDFDLDSGVIRAVAGGSGVELDVPVCGTLTAGFGKLGAPEVDAYTCLPAVAHCAEITSSLCAADGPKGVSDQYAHEGKIIAMAHGQANAEIKTDGSAPTLTCVHEAPIVTQPIPYGIGEHPEVAHCLRSGASKADKHESTTYIAQPVAVYADTTHTLRGEGFDASEDGTGRGTPLVPVTQPVTYDLFNVTAPVNRQNRTPGDPCHTLARSNAEHAAVVQPIQFGAQMSVPQVDVNLCQTLQAKNPAAVAVGWDEELNASEEQSGTLLRGGQGGRHDGVMTPAMQVRRLTPIECERLQGFPDGYTAIEWRNKPVSECPDGPRYKALGNSWAVPCVQWIGSRIRMEVLRGLA